MDMIVMEAALRGRFTPMPPKLHLGFCLFATVVFLIIFLRRKTVSSLVWLLICDTTAILQFYSDKTTATAVAVCEVFLFAVLIWTSLNERKARKRSEAKRVIEEADPDDDDSDNLDDLEHLIKSERGNIADNSGGIINNAFEDDKA